MTSNAGRPMPASLQALLSSPGPPVTGSNHSGKTQRKTHEKHQNEHILTF